MKRIAIAALALMLAVGSFAGGGSHKHAAKKVCTKCEKSQCTPLCSQTGCCKKS